MPDADTLAVHAGEPSMDRPDAPIVPDISVAAAAAYPDLESVDAAMAAHRGYGRWGTANHAQLEAAVAALEAAGAAGPVEALAVASGMAAITMAVLTETAAGDHVVVAGDCYGATVTFVRDDLPRFGLTASVVDVQDLDAVRAAITPKTRVLLCEICTNPLIRVPDLEALAAITRAAGVLLVVDATVPTPALCQPLRWGADVVVHSATKNLSGHADVIGGVVVGRPAWIAGARSLVHTMGPALGAFEAWLTLRGIRTLGVRMERHVANACGLSAMLAGHPAVARVHYPSLPGSPFRTRATRLLPRGAGALFSFDLEGGKPQVDRMVRRLRLVRLMPSLGHVATTVSHPATTSHRGLSPQDRQRVGISDGLVRCSVGLEHLDDLLEDVAQALRDAS
ncbi:MAG TPA: aminotransferase class I/II-fold pyridoxal phosphate-dependent enzyme [Candidatus Limnocylindrales bacterium]|nr:aminotransferase class I/II-fold pyridoxal phosphate-dependent enzyme [Candidatus Limnocylindrales bacterium]